MVNADVESFAVGIGERFTVSFERTLRLPDDGKSYPLPPGLGALPVRRATDLGAALEGEAIDVIVPLHENEALFIYFHAAPDQPRAVQIGVGEINAVSGEGWDILLQAKPQNYLVCPSQPWLDGIKSADGQVRQFVAVPLGRGQTIEAQLTEQETVGGIQIRVYEPRPGSIPAALPTNQDTFVPEATEDTGLESVGLMGLGAGGQMHQKVYPDAYGIKTWELQPSATLRVGLLTAADYHALTGEELPPTPVNPVLYTAYGLPWFTLDD